MKQIRLQWNLKSLNATDRKELYDMILYFTFQNDRSSCIEVYMKFPDILESFTFSTFLDTNVSL